MDYVNRFENEVTEVFAKEDTTQGVKSDTFEHHVNRMATAYNKMKNSIEEKYAAQDYEQEYYVTESGKIEELTKEKELDMLNLNVSDGDRKMLNGIWDYYANKR